MKITLSRCVTASTRLHSKTARVVPVSRQAASCLASYIQLEVLKAGLRGDRGRLMVRNQAIKAW